ncbi:MAG: hypothetical protein J0M26_18025 [Planctomycetes bacterium]|nr:hypothetical protein [Planctomycetota bacterium]
MSVKLSNYLQLVQQHSKAAELSDELKGNLETLLCKLKNVRPTRNGFKACCPSHDDGTPSLSISIIEGRTLIHCFAGCGYHEIMCSLKLPPNFLSAGGIKNPQSGSRCNPPKTLSATPVNPDLKMEYAYLYKQRDKKCLDAFAKSLGVTVASLRLLGAVGSQHSSLITPEYNGCGEICGLQERQLDDTKLARKGSRRGLYLPSGWNSEEKHGNKVLYICEGASDTAAALSHGFRAIGRPSSNGGKVDLAILLKDFPFEIAVVADNDPDRCGTKGAYEVAQFLAQELKKEIPVCKPKGNAKDVRAYVNNQVSVGEN